MPHRYAPRHDGTGKIQILLTPFAKGGKGSWVRIFILNWCHVSGKTVYPVNIIK
ncbi:MAG: hypothetical protein GX432_07525 [Candidatus Atribacteria bacterium]|nr:hypothetical protein [Candidatus Atribacteria bacterium]